MEPPTIKETDEETPEAAHDGDFYYMKAMNYLALSSSESIQSESDSCAACLHCPESPDDKDDDDDNQFTLGFRRGLTRDHDDLHSSGSSSSISSSPRGSDCGNSQNSGSAATSSSPSPTASSLKPASPKRSRERKCSIGGRFYKTGSSEFGKIEPKRKLSDGHVHWADEFQKELIRCNPRKSYTRHPSHVSSQVKPILKVTLDENEQS